MFKHKQLKSRATQLACSLCLLVLLNVTAYSLSESDYHKHVKQAVTALDTLAQSDETESITSFSQRDAETASA